MNTVSKHGQHVGRIFIRSRFLEQLCVPRRCHSLELKDMDKESYLNKRSVKGQLGFIGYFTLAVPVTCFGLAIWQINRLKWKNRLIQDLEERTKLPPIELPEDLTDRKALEYRRVRVRGTFDHSREVYIGPRSKIIDNSFADPIPFLMPSFGTAPEKPNIGLIVVTPFKVADRDVEILVNRGWVPSDQQEPETRRDGQIEGEVEIEGVIRLKEAKPTAVHRRPDPRYFSYRDIESIAELVNTSHFYIDATVESSVPGGPLGGQTQINISNNHRGYIITWSILSAYSGWMWHKRWIRRLH